MRGLTLKTENYKVKLKSRNYYLNKSLMSICNKIIADIENYSNTLVLFWMIKSRPITKIKSY